MAYGRIVILGLGNILCGDDAFGIRVVERLYGGYDFPANVEIVDGGTRGPALYTHVREAEALIVVDAVDLGLEPGSRIVRDGNLPCWLGIKKMGAHQNSFAELLALAELKNTLPASIFLVGLQPCALEFASPISRQACESLDWAVQKCLEILQGLGIRPEKAKAPKFLLPRELRADAGN